MNLECEGGMQAKSVTAQQLRQAFADDTARGEFIILSAQDQVYIQAAGEDEGPYELEYREGGDQTHFRCTDELTKQQVEAAFVKYLEGDASWRQDHRWEPLYPDAWPKTSDEDKGPEAKGAHKHKRRWWRRIFIALAILAVIYLMPFPFLSDSTRMDVQEATVRWLLTHNHAGTRLPQVCFVGLGQSFDFEVADMSMKDPSEAFMKRLADLPVPALPLSQAQEAPSPPGHLGGMIADEHGRVGLILGVGDVERRSLGVAVCQGRYHEAALSAAGYKVYLIRVPFGWIAVTSSMMWVS